MYGSQEQQILFNHKSKAASKMFLAVDQSVFPKPNFFYTVVCRLQLTSPKSIGYIQPNKAHNSAPHNFQYNKVLNMWETVGNKIVGCVEPEKLQRNQLQVVGLEKI